MQPLLSILRSGGRAGYRGALVCRACYVRMILRLLTPLVCRWSRCLSQCYAHHWGLLRLTYYDQLYNAIGGPRNWLWVERGYLACRDMAPQSVVLDIGCATGVYAGCFYAPRVKFVDAVDCCLSAIRVARRRYGDVANLRFAVRNIVTDPFPSPSYHVVVCNAVLEYLKRDEMGIVLNKVRLALRSDGVLIGHTPIKPNAANYQFGSKSNISTRAELVGMLTQCFNGVETWPSLETWRTSVYFRCTQPRMGG
jgi:2-polyprenyl-3-methyl-5-hydroxy-6-metoxy-1,4-benzoquinol methylase